MKKHVLALSALLVLFAVSIGLGQGFVSPEITIASNTLTMVAGPASAKWAPAWTSNTVYSQGAVVKSQAAGSVYFAVVGGTSTNVAAAYPSGIGNITDGTVTWRNAPSSARTSFSIQDVGSSSTCKTYVFMKYGSGTNLANVVTLFGNGGSYSCSAAETPQSAVYVLSTVNTKITVNE